MKSILYIVLVLVASLVTTSLDAVPDPPALNPHILDLKITGPRESPSGPDQQQILHSPLCIAPGIGFRRVDLAAVARPSRPVDERAVVVCAADPSPPGSA